MNKKILIIIFVCVGVLVACNKHKNTSSNESFVNYKEVKTPDFNADSAYNFVKIQCDFGPRIPESKAAEDCAAFLASYLSSKADTVYIQEFDATLWNGKKVKGRNIIASFNIEATDRVLFASHWDSRMWADRDEEASNRNKPITGANDGASGVGVLLEIARLLHAQTLTQGLDIVLFDLEDQGAPQWEEDGREDQTDWCLGSQYWSQNLHIPYYRAKYGVLLDMVGYKNLRFTKEVQSMGYASSIMNNIWNIASDLGFDSIFIADQTNSVMDDHIWINHYAKIPTIDIVQNSNGVSFFPYWHTSKDDINCIDKQSLATVGKVLLVSFFAAEQQ
ncbi:MAG: M28 family peptidase [Bacteroidales bacterium]|nr:M28 family peptidase [Bacteroidales bacterium]